MLLLVISLQIVMLVVLALLLLRKPATPVTDARMLQLPDQVTRLEARSEAQERRLLADVLAEAEKSRAAADAGAQALRSEVVRTIQQLGGALNQGLETFRADNKGSAEALRLAVGQTLERLTERLTQFSADAARNQLEARDALHTRLSGLAAANVAEQEKLRGTVQERLDHLTAANTAKLEEMRATVDEKLHATLHTRLTESFGQVTDQLNKVHSGLGEMTKLSEGVDGLSRIFTNVRTRGTIGEVLLGKLIEQVLAPTQFVRNAHVRPGSREVVEFAIRFPGADGETLLPVDSKFPHEDWDRLETAYATTQVKEIEAAGRAFEAAIRKQAKDICEKYINEPVTTPYAMMYLPTENLYAEVLRRDGLQSELQHSCRVMVAGPSTFSAMLISFQMGFSMLNLQRKGSDVWKTLAKTRTEFEKFGGLMESMEKQVGTVQNTIQKLNVRTRAIQRDLKEVGDGESEPSNVLAFESFSEVAPLLAASGDQ